MRFFALRFTFRRAIQLGIVFLARAIQGSKRRVVRGNDLSDGGRRVHGRKGIGKLAAFGTAPILECLTKKDRVVTSFRLDYEKIRKRTPTEDYDVEQAAFLGDLVNPKTGEPLNSGTRITLTGLLLKRSIAESNFTASMSRRFALDSAQMTVYINDEPLPLYDVPTAYRFPADGVPDDADIAVENGWAIEQLGVGQEVRWWIGFTENTLRDDAQQGISILTRGKMAQRPFKFERGGGVTGQLGQEYLVGEVVAEWLDEGLDIDSDLIQSNRDQVQFEDSRLADFVEWGQRRLTWALRRRQKLMEDAAYESFVASENITHMLQPFTKVEQRKYLQIARAASRINEMKAADVEHLMQQVIDAQSDLAVREMMERISEADDVVQSEMWFLVKQFSLIDARKTLSILEARVATIKRLEEALESGEREVPEIHNLIKNDPWLIDPRYELLEDEKDMSRFGLGFTPETDEETGIP